MVVSAALPLEFCERVHRPLGDEGALKFSEDHLEASHRSTMRSGEVDVFCDRDQADLAATESLEQRKALGCVSPQSIKSDDNDRVRRGCPCVQEPGDLRSPGSLRERFGAADGGVDDLVHDVSSGGFSPSPHSRLLSIEAEPIVLLFGGADPCVGNASIVALEPVETLSLPAKAFRELCETHPQVEQFVSSLLARRIEQLSRSLLEALYIGLDRRVYDVCWI